MTSADLSIAQLHATILTWIIDRGYAPDVDDLSAALRASQDTVAQALDDLQAYHGVVLHPNRPAVWVIHPFATAPTLFLIQAEAKKWWANCVWCALGAAALLDRDLTISTLLGGEEQHVTLHIRQGQLLEQDYWVHFPIPMRQAWDNVIYTCSTMLLFRDREQVTAWSQRHHIPQGDIQPVQTVWAFARRWYGNHLSPTWTKWTTAQAQDIFTEFGLTADTWQLPRTGERF